MFDCLYSGDHCYKQNKSLSAAEQMISPLPDIKELQLTQEDEFIIIACDGIWNSLSSQEAVDFVKENMAEHPDRLISTVCEDVSVFFYLCSDVLIIITICHVLLLPSRRESHVQSGFACTLIQHTP